MRWQHCKPSFEGIPVEFRACHRSKGQMCDRCYTGRSREVTNTILPVDERGSVAGAWNHIDFDEGIFILGGPGIDGESLI